MQRMFYSKLCNDPYFFQPEKKSICTDTWRPSMKAQKRAEQEALRGGWGSKVKVSRLSEP